MDQQKARIRVGSIKLIAGICALVLTQTELRLLADIPAPIAGDTIPTIELAATNSYAGQTVGISGEGALGYASVRIVILADIDGDGQPDRSRLLATASTGGGDTYAAGIEIPQQIAIGPTWICAAVDAETAGFACAEFEVTAPPPASVVGTIGLAATEGDTELLVYDSLTGDEIVAAAIDAGGGFAVSGLPPGAYQLVVAGEVIEPFDIADVVLSPGGTLVIDEPAALRGGGLVSDISCSVMTFAGPLVRISRVVSDVHGLPVPGITGIEAPNVGRFIAGAGGPPLAVTFTAKVQAPTAATELFGEAAPDGPIEGIAGVRFRIVDSAGNFVWEDVDTNGVPFAVTHPDVSSLAIGRYIIGCAVKRTNPTLEALLGQCWGKYAEFEVIDNPTADGLYSSGALNWLPDDSRYAFAGWMPDIAGLLSVDFPKGGLFVPYLGDLTSGFNAGVYVSGFINLNGHVTMTGSRAAAQVRLLGRNIYDESFLDFLDGSTAGEAGAVFGGPLGPFGEERDPRRFTLRSSPHYLYSFFQSWPVWSGTVLDLWGLISVRVSIDLALTAYGYLYTTQQPIEPRLGATFIPEAVFSVNVAVKVSILFGLARGRADVRTDAFVNWPVQYDSGVVPNIFLDDPCLGIRMELTASAKKLGRKRRYTYGPIELFCEENGACPGLCAGRSRGATPPAIFPDADAVPALAAGPGGSVLAAYVEDTNSNGVNLGQGEPDQTVIARFWNPGTEDWGPPLVVSDQQFAASDPSVAFTGPSGDAWFVYTQSTIDEDAAPAPDEIETVLAAQEIVAVQWNNNLQSFTHEFLTTDASPIGDGSASLDADGFGATAAWMRDIDGDISTRNDWTIAVRNWIDGLGWDDMELLDASAALDALLGGTHDALNAEVVVVREGGNAYLVWTADGDADIDTHDDRRIVLAAGTPVPSPTAATPHYFSWAIEAPAALPAGAEQPSADINPQTGAIEIAFTVRGKDADGLTDAGVGTSNLLWHARRDGGGTWSAAQLLDDGDTIRCEAPQIRVGPTGRTVTFMRRFDDSTIGRYRGQLAMTVREATTNAWSPPAWITDESSQHWDQALAINSNGHTFMVDVNRLDAPPGSPAAETNGCLPVADLNDVDEPVQFRILPPEADPAIDAQVVASSLHAAVGAEITVTAIVRNAGVNLATNIRVQFFDGSDEFAPLLDEVPIAGPLAFNQSAPAQIVVERACGPQPIFCRLLVDAPGEDRCTLNNSADVLDIGLLSPPLRTSATISTLAANAVEITAVAPDTDEIAGYRFLRAQNSGGPYANVGESVYPVLTDLDVTRGITYYYTVAAFDTCGVISARSTEALIDLPDLVTRNWAVPLSDNWHNPAAWAPPGIPGEGDDLTVNAPGTYAITLTQDTSAGSLLLGFPPGTKTLNMGNRTLSLLKPSLIAPGGTLQSTGGSLLLNHGALSNQGIIEMRGPGNLVSGRMINDAGGQFQVRATSPAPADLTIDQGLVNNGQLTLDAAGFPAPITLDVQIGILAIGPTGTLVSLPGPGPQNIVRAALRNAGVVTVHKDLEFDEPLAAHANLGQINVAGGNLTFTLSGAGSTLTNAGQIDVAPARQLSVTGGPVQHGGILNIAPGAFASIAATFTQHTGTTTCDGTLSAAQIDLLGGTFGGSGQLAGPLNNQAGTLNPGTSPGTLSAAGGYTQGPSGILKIELAGLIPGSGYDVLSVTGSADLDGILQVELLAFDPPLGAMFDVLTTTGGTITGEFADITPHVLPNGRAVTATYLPDRVRLTVVCAPADADCDGDVDTDDHALFVDCLFGPNATPVPTPPTTQQDCLDAFDADQDADVDLLDFAAFTTLFTGG